jgi:hypothetical protein
MAMCEVAKRIAKRSLFARRSDTPLDHTLVRILARRQTQQLNQMLRGIVIVVMSVVLNDEAHDVLTY